MAEDYSGIDVSNDVLEHHGRMGMKWYKHIFGDDPRWGKHGRTTGNKQREGTTPPKDYAEDNNQPVHDKDGEKKSVKDRYHGAHKPVSMMSYQELSDSIDRMKMEKTYRDLMNDLNPKPQKKTSRLEKIANKAVDSLADTGIKIGVDYIEDGIRKSLGLKERKDPIINLKDFRKDPSKYEGKLTNKQLKDLGDAAKAENKAKGHSDDYEEDRSLNVTDFMRNPEKYKDYEFTNKDLDNIEKYGKTYNKYYGERDTDNGNSRTERTANVNSNTDYMQEHRRRMNEAVNNYKKEHPNTNLDDDDIARNLGYTGGYISYGVDEMDKKTLDFLEHYGIDPTDAFLEHHGIKGIKWGVRRYQNPDGSLTAAGMRRYYGSINRSVSGQRKIAAGPIGTSAGLSAAISMPAGPIGMLTAATVASGASFALQALRVHGTKKADKFVLENKKAYLKAVDKKNAELYEETGSTLFKTNFADNAKDVDITLDGKNVNVTQHIDDKNTKYADGKTKKEGTHITIDEWDSWTDPIDKNGHYRWDDDGNLFYNKTSSDIAKEKDGNSKLNDITNDHYESLDRDLFEYGHYKYAQQPLKTRQKLIKDLDYSRKQRFADPIEFDVNEHGSRPTKEQTLRNNYEAYLDRHPNSDLTFNEFNSWYYID